ncbi:MAG: hypothetical protein CMO40_09585 [Verrucomicrobiaceae bacterium]|nr:hypothetical protein [Verrucomicrobiaceae bacterium]
MSSGWGAGFNSPALKFSLFFNPVRPWLGILLAGLSAQVRAENDDHPRAAYPGSFSRPPSKGMSYDTWEGARGPDVGVKRADPARLPSRVDNSQRAEYPPVYQQRWGTCGQFTSIASIFTYEMNILNRTRADRDANCFPAYFSWNMMNRARNVGSEAYHGWEVAKRIGIPTTRSYGGVGRTKIGAWPDGYGVWREAMEYRIAGYRYSPATTIAQLDEARGWMFDRNFPASGKKPTGGIFALDGRMGEMKKVTVTIPDGEYGAGADLWTRWGPSGYGHGITCVGYDDRVGYDLNGDGVITTNLDLNGDGHVTLADWERGAYIVVNSWGPKWSEDGRIYLLYSAMIDPTWKRGNYLGRVEVRKHLPRRTARLKLAFSNRTDLRVTIGLAADPAATEATVTFSPQLLNGWPLFGRANAGDVPMAGPGDTRPLEIGIELTELFADLEENDSGEARVFLSFETAADSAASGLLHECAIRSYDQDGRFENEVGLDVLEGVIGKGPLVITGLVDRVR